MPTPCSSFQPNLASTGNEYKVMVCRSTSPTGPFTDQAGRSCQNGNGGTLVLGSHDNVYAPGGQGIIYDTDTSGVALYYHYGKC
jgi:arabinan endo-1,5-alpha-L-arabinosidase